MDRLPVRPPLAPSATGWRLLLAFDQPGVCHMAADDALHTSFVAGRDRPILRLYSWAPACLSLGYAQPVAGIDQAACRRAGVDVVRRPSGGRAVLHDRELTYAVIASVADPVVGGTIAETYQVIASGLLAGLRALGVAARLAPGTSAGDLAARRSGACFAVATRHEIVWQGRKLAGSAQLRRNGVVLQHGSLLLDHGPTPLATLLRSASGVASSLAHHLTTASATVASILGEGPTPAAAASVIAPAFAATLGITLQPDQLTAAEAALAHRLCHDRYATDAWTQRH